MKGKKGTPSDKVTSSGYGQPYVKGKPSRKVTPRNSVDIEETTVVAIDNQTVVDIDNQRVVDIDNQTVDIEHQPVVAIETQTVDIDNQPVVAIDNQPVVAIVNKPVVAIANQPVVAKDNQTVAKVNQKVAKDNQPEIEEEDGIVGADAFSEDEVKTKMRVTSLAPEQMGTIQDEQLAKFQKLIKAAQSSGSYTNTEGEYTSEVKEVVMTLYKLYHQLSKAKQLLPSVVTKWRNRLATVAKNTKTLEMMCEILVETTYPQKWFNEDGKLIELVKNTVQNLQIYSATSSDFSMAVGQYPGLCAKIKAMLEDTLENHLNKTPTVSTRHGFHKATQVEIMLKLNRSYSTLSGKLGKVYSQKIAEEFRLAETDNSPTITPDISGLFRLPKENLTTSCMLLVRTLSAQDSTIGCLRAAQFQPLLVSYLATPKDKMRLGVLATLAAIVNEKECESIKTNVQVVKFLLKVTAKDSSSRTTKGWSNKESLKTIRMLARNDANKKLLVELDALKVLVKMVKADNVDDQYEALCALWQLSFDPANRKIISANKELGIVGLFTTLKDSEDKRIKKVCTGFLWTLKNAEVESLGLKSSKGGGHVMISYQGGDQKTLKQIAVQLKNAGMKVWMDIDQVGGSTLEAKAKAVDEASVVLMGISQKYKNGPFCRAVAEYASRREKTIIPLKMEQGYMPDGWLGLICGTMKQTRMLKFCGKYKFEERMGNLLKELAIMFMKTGKQESSDVQLPTLPVQAAPQTAIPPFRPVQGDMRPQVAPVAPVTTTTGTDPKFTQMLQSVREWQPEEVKQWIEKNDLTTLKLADSLTGNDVAFLMRMNQQAPKSFFQCLQDPKTMKQLLKMSKMTWALDDLTEGQ